MKKINSIHGFIIILVVLLQLAACNADTKDNSNDSSSKSRSNQTEEIGTNSTPSNDEDLETDVNTIANINSIRNGSYYLLEDGHQCKTRGGSSIESYVDRLDFGRSQDGLVYVSQWRNRCNDAGKRLSLNDDLLKVGADGLTVTYNGVVYTWYENDPIPQPPADTKW